MQPLIFMFHAGLIPPHVKQAVALLGTQNRFVFAGTTNPENTQAFFVDIAGHSDSFRFVNTNYVHTSANSRDFEMMSIWRWFVLADELKRQSHAGPVICVDSDIFAFDDLTLILSRFDGIAGFGANQAPGICFFRSADVLHDLVTLMRRALADPAIIATDAPVVDMTYIHHWCSGAGDIAQLQNVTDEGIYDYAIGGDQPGSVRFLCDDFGKVVVWREGKPHFVRTDSNTLVRAFTLHIQGTAKRYWQRWLPKPH